MHGYQYITGVESLSCENEKRTQINYYMIIYKTISVDMSHVRTWDTDNATTHMALFNEIVAINETNTNIHI